MKNPRISFNIWKRSIAITANDFVMTGSWEVYKEFTQKNLRTLVYFNVNPRELRGFDVVGNDDIHLPTLYLEVIPMAIKMASQLGWDDIEKVDITSKQRNRAVECGKLSCKHEELKAVLKSYGILPPYDKRQIARHVTCMVTGALKHCGCLPSNPDTGIRIDPKLVEALKFVLDADVDDLSRITGLPVKLFTPKEEPDDDSLENNEGFMQFLAHITKDPSDHEIDLHKIIQKDSDSTDTEIKKLAHILNLEPAEITPPFDRNKVAEKIGATLRENLTEAKEEADQFTELRIFPEVLEAIETVLNTTDVKELSTLLKVPKECLAQLACKDEEEEFTSDMAAKLFSMAMAAKVLSMSPAEFHDEPDSTSEREKLKKDSDEFREITKVIKGMLGPIPLSSEKDDDLTYEQKWAKLEELHKAMMRLKELQSILSTIK